MHPSACRRRSGRKPNISRARVPPPPPHGGTGGALTWKRISQSNQRPWQHASATPPPRTLAATRGATSADHTRDATAEKRASAAAVARAASWWRMWIITTGGRETAARSRGRSFLFGARARDRESTRGSSNWCLPCLTLWPHARARARAVTVSRALNWSAIDDNTPATRTTRLVHFLLGRWRVSFSSDRKIMITR